MFGLSKSSSNTDISSLFPEIAAGNILLVDVREAGEVAMTGKAKGALHVPLMHLPMVTDPRHPDFDPRFDLQKPVALYCASGARSGQGQAFMKNLGYADVTNLGGLQHWVSAGGEVE